MKKNIIPIIVAVILIATVTSQMLTIYNLNADIETLADKNRELKAEVNEKNSIISTLSKTSANNTQDTNKGTTTQKQDSKKPAQNSKYDIVSVYGDVATNSIGTTYMQVAVVIENTGNTNLYLDDASFDIETTTGELVASVSGVYGYPQVIAPGERGVFFEAFSNDNLDEAQAYNLVPHLYVKKATVDLIRFEYSDIKIQDDSYSISILGRVHNNTAKDESTAKIVVICYDKNNNVIDVIHSYKDFAAGEKKGFEISHYPRIDIKASDIANYDVYVYPHQYQFD